MYKHRNYYRDVEKLFNRISAVDHTGLKVEEINARSEKESERTQKMNLCDQSSKRTKEEKNRIFLFYVLYGRLFIWCGIRNGVGSPK